MTQSFSAAAQSARIANALDQRRSAIHAQGWRSWCLISGASYLLLLAAALSGALALNHGTFVYALDDAYIHLSLAHNWLRWHGFGVSPGQVAVPSSSPIWTTLVTAVGATFGLASALPLILNVLASLASLTIFWWGWSRMCAPSSASGSDTKRRWIVAALVPLLLNLPALSLSGMEATLHAALVLAFVISVLTSTPKRGHLFVACTLSCVLVWVRLESCFVIAAGAVVLWRRQQTGRGLAIVASAVASVLALALVLHAHNGLYVPNSIVIKGLPASWLGLELKVWTSLLGLARNPLMLAVLIGSWACRRGQQPRIQDGFFLVLLSALLHLALSCVSGVFALDRYESYLVDMALLLLLCSDLRALRMALTPSGERPWRLALARAIVACGVLEKVALLVVVALGSNDMYLQHFQMASLIAQEFPHANVVVNDIGLISLRAGGTVTDLVGLGSTDVLRAVRKSGDHRSLDHAAIDSILDKNGADLIAIYADWFSPRLYGAWQPVAAWSLQRLNMTAGGRTIVFFARAPSQADGIRRRLTSFEPRLPSGVRVRYAGRDFPADADLQNL